MIPARPLALRTARALPPLLAALALGAHAPAALAAQCGGPPLNRVCDCNDVVVTNYTLPGDLSCATTSGLRITAASAAGVVLDGNGRTITMETPNGHGVRIVNADGAVVRNLTVTALPAAPGTRGVEINTASDVTIEDNVFSGLSEGVWAGGGAGVDPGLTIRNNDLSASTLRGATVLGATADLVIAGNDFSTSTEALLVRDLVGPWTLDAADGNDFTDVSRSDNATDTVVALQSVTDVTLDGLDLSTDPTFPDSYHDGVGVKFTGSVGVTISNCDLSGRYRGIEAASDGAVLNSDGHLLGNDVSDADHYGMYLSDWTDVPELANDIFDDSDNGLRLADVALAAPADLELDTCSFDNVGESFDQAALRLVRTSNLVVRHFEANVVSRSIGIEAEDNTDLEIAEALVCGSGRIGVSLATGNAATGSDRTVFGAYGDVYVENEAGSATRPGINVSISAESDDTVLGTVIGSGEPDLALSDASATTTGTVSRVGTTGWAFDDADVDTCNDLCSDGVDSDGDTVCDEGDFGGPVTILTRGSVPWVPAGSGVGSPTVVFDPTAGRWLMLFEVMTAAPDASCVHGYWSLGMAVSLNGVNWLPGSAPVAEPTPGTPYACVAAQPTVVNNGGVNTIWFKAEDETGYRGIGRMIAQWNGATFSFTGPDPTVALAEARTFGYLHGVFDTTLSGFGAYRFLLARYPSIYATSGGNTTPLAALTGPLLAPGFGPGWSSDEAFNPAVACGRNGGWTMFAGGRDTTPITGGYDIDQQYLGRCESDDFTSWTRVADAPALSTVTGAPEHRHWDVLPLGDDGQYVVFFDDQGGAGGTNRIRAEVIGGVSWTAAVAADVGTKVCTP